MIEFRIDGPLMGAVRMTQRSKWAPRAKAYLRYQGRVRLVALAAGVRELTVPTVVRISAFWKIKPRADLDNIIKAVLDSCWEQDRLVWEIYAENRKSKTGEEYAVVQVEAMNPGRATR